jgi:cytochrome bd-type quinol oxidase subunit 1
LKTSDARSPLVGTSSLLITLIGYTLIYGVLLVIGGRLFLREVAHGPQDELPEGPAPEREDAPREDLVLAY